jgi:organic hydroperoxide reductase OsmC/OhrA
MSLSQHHYSLAVHWTGNLGEGTSSYRGYSRDHDILIPGLPVLKGSADPTFHGDRDRYNPEQLLLAALAQCHMLSFLHVAVRHGVVVTDYRDEATGRLRLNQDGSGQFESVTLNPHVTVADEAHVGLAEQMHREANQVCFIARSVNFPVQHSPVTVAAPSRAN